VKPVVLAIDGGGAHVGIVIRHDLNGHPDPHPQHWPVTRRPIEDLPSWIDRVMHAVTEAAGRVYSYGYPAQAAGTATPGPFLLALEDLTEPNPHAGHVTPGLVAAMAEAAHISGAIIHRYGRRQSFRLILVPPGGHGRAQPLRQAYPACLVGPRETTGRGKGPLQHCRAAYDVAGAATVMDRYWQHSRDGEQAGHR
jgi:hypothetical protein